MRLSKQSVQWYAWRYARRLGSIERLCEGSKSLPSKPHDDQEITCFSRIAYM